MAETSMRTRPTECFIHVVGIGAAHRNAAAPAGHNGGFFA
jgi:hypothetical protein